MEFLKTIVWFDCIGYLAMALFMGNAITMAVMSGAKYLKTFASILLALSAAAIYLTPISVFNYAGLITVVLMIIGFTGAFLQDDHKFGRFDFATSGLLALFVAIMPGVLAGHAASYAFEAIGKQIKSNTDLQAQSNEASMEDNIGTEMIAVDSAQSEIEAKIALYEDVLQGTEYPEERAMIIKYIKSLKAELKG